MAVCNERVDFIPDSLVGKFMTGFGAGTREVRCTAPVSGHLQGLQEAEEPKQI